MTRICQHRNIWMKSGVTEMTLGDLGERLDPVVNGVDCTIHESWMNKCQPQGEHYFHAQDSIPAHRDQRHRVHYRKLENWKKKKEKKNIDCYCYCTELYTTTEKIWNLLNKNSLLPSWYCITYDKFTIWKIAKQQKCLHWKWYNNIVKRSQGILMQHMSVSLGQALKVSHPGESAHK